MNGHAYLFAVLAQNRLLELDDPSRRWQHHFDPRRCPEGPRKTDLSKRTSDPRERRRRKAILSGWRPRAGGPRSVTAA